MNIKREKIADNILCLTFETRYEMGMTMVRLQEFYESPKFKGEYFTFDDFIDYWSNEYGRGGAFDYPVRWKGYNLSSSVIGEWIEKFWYLEDDVRAKEEDLYYILHSEFGPYRDGWEDFYVIAVAETDSEEERQGIIDHELSHAMYHLNPEYKAKCDEILREDFKGDHGEMIKKYMSMTLEKKGYHSDVLDDETVAYLSTRELSLIGIGEEDGKHKGITALRDNFNLFKKS